MLRLTVADDGTGFPRRRDEYPAAFDRRTGCRSWRLTRGRIRRRRHQLEFALPLDGRRCPVLLADDHPFMRRASRRCCAAPASRSSRWPTTATKRSPRSPGTIREICIFDVRMPKRSGVEALQAMRARGHAPGCAADRRARGSFAAQRGARRGQRDRPQGRRRGRAARRAREGGDGREGHPAARCCSARSTCRSPAARPTRSARSPRASGRSRRTSAAACATAKSPTRWRCPKAR